MTIQQYIENNYEELRTICYNITHNDPLTEDLFQETIIILLEYNPEKLNKILENNHIKYFYISIILRQFKSATSPFYKKFKKEKFIQLNEEINTQLDEIYSDDDAEYDKMLNNLTNEVNKSHIYMKKLIELKFNEGLSYRQINQLTKIPRSSLYSSFDNWRKEIKIKYKNYNNGSN